MDDEIDFLDSDGAGVNDQLAFQGPEFESSRITNTTKIPGMVVDLIGAEQCYKWADHLVPISPHFKKGNVLGYSTP